MISPRGLAGPYGMIHDPNGMRGNRGSRLKALGNTDGTRNAA
jgi:hypothetical protein